MAGWGAFEGEDKAAERESKEGGGMGKRREANACVSTEKLMVALRDGRKLIGVLRSWDQFGELPCVILKAPMY